jgi:asparagine synthetase B (glutamine-hydrolysing)
MCGISGIFDIRANREISEPLLISMRDKLIHRGPDEAGTFIQVSALLIAGYRSSTYPPANNL